jgi:hypothetical protein
VDEGVCAKAAVARSAEPTNAVDMYFTNMRRLLLQNHWGSNTRKQRAFPECAPMSLLMMKGWIAETGCSRNCDVSDALSFASIVA